MTRAEVEAAARDLVQRSCAEQGLPECVTDRSVLANVATLLTSGRSREASRPGVGGAQQTDAVISGAVDARTDRVSARGAAVALNGAR